MLSSRCSVRLLKCHGLVGWGVLFVTSFWSLPQRGKKPQTVAIKSKSWCSQNGRGVLQGLVHDLLCGYVALEVSCENKEPTLSWFQVRDVTHIYLLNIWFSNFSNSSIACCNDCWTSWNTSFWRRLQGFWGEILFHKAVDEDCMSELKAPLGSAITLRFGTIPNVDPAQLCLWISTGGQWWHLGCKTTVKQHSEPFFWQSLLQALQVAEPKIQKKV